MEREERVRARTAQKVGAALEVNPRSIGQAYFEPEEAPHVGDMFARLVKDGSI